MVGWAVGWAVAVDVRFGHLEVVDLGVFLGRVELFCGEVDGVVGRDVAHGGCGGEAAEGSDGDVSRSHLGWSRSSKF